jgi:hypothetical protein
MELLLNLAWLLLALPAYWLWHGRESARKFSSLQCLLALGCMLVILFPVVSATDDLRAVLSEMEEAPIGKRSMRQSSNDKVAACKWQSPPALTVTSRSLIVSDEAWRQRSAPCLSMSPAPPIERTGRAPPTSFLA